MCLHDKRYWGKELISIIITAYSRPIKLEQTLIGFLRQDIHEEIVDYEIIVVDNHPQSISKNSIDMLNKGSGRKIRYFQEPRRGKCYALHLGIKESFGNILTFTDEDNLPEKDYLCNIQKEFNANSDIKIITGKVLKKNPGDAYMTIKEDNDYNIYSWPCSPWKVGHGSNVSIKKEVLKRIGVYDIGFGPGTFVGSAEDTDLIYRILKNGYKILYSPKIINYHDHGRNSVEEIKNVKYAYAKGRGAFYCKHILRGDIYVAKLFYLETRRLLKMFFKYRVKTDYAVSNLKGLFSGLLYRMFIEPKLFCLKTKM